MRAEGGRGRRPRRKATLATTASRKGGSALSTLRGLQAVEVGLVFGRPRAARRKRRWYVSEEN